MLFLSTGSTVVKSLLGGNTHETYNALQLGFVGSLHERMRYDDAAGYFSFSLTYIADLTIGYSDDTGSKRSA